jgi:ATP-dependent helicase/DNAse subunit B
MTYRHFRELFLAKGLDEALKELSENDKSSGDILTIMTFCNEFKDVFEDEKLQVELFDDIAKEEKAKEVSLKPAVHVTSSYIVPPNALVHIFNFSFGVFPSSAKDIDFLSDKEKEELNLYSSSVKNEQSRFNLMNLLSSPNLKSITFKETDDGKTIPSLLATDLNLENISNPVLDYEYALDKGALFEAYLLDRKNYLDDSDPRLDSYLKEVPISYESYDPSFKPFSLVKKEDKITLSASSLKSFYQCPFRFYLSKYVRVDDSEDHFSAFLGSLYHAVLAKMYDEDFDFDKAWEEEKQAEIEKRQFVCDPTQQVLLIKLKEQLKKLIKFYQLHEDKDHMDLDEKPFCEVPINVDIAETPNLTITGSIDKVVFTGGEYLAILDYKTSNYDNFNASMFEYGLNVQLPFYAFATTRMEQFKDRTIFGFFIGHVINGDIYSLNKSFEETDFSWAKLVGVYLNDDKALKSFDSQYTDSGFVRGCKLTSAGILAKTRSSNGAFSKEEINDMVEKLLDLLKNSEKEIRNNNFTISPKVFKSFTSCGFCPFRDICYRDEESVVYLDNSEDKQANE